MRLLAIVVPKLGAVAILAPHYARPVLYDTTKLRGLLGQQARTPLPEAGAATLDWLAAQDRG